MDRIVRRKVLKGLRRPPSCHAGLWLDRYLEFQPATKERAEEAAAAAKARHLGELTGLSVPEGYKEAFARRCELLMAGGAKQAQAQTTGRLVIGLGQKGPVEAGLRLEHSWGVPLLPGSALKGLCTRTANDLLVDPAWQRDGASYRTLFGTTDDSGVVCFHDAWWDPTEESTLPLHLDVMTVHHPDYYQAGTVPPADWDSPTPVPFLSVTGRFAVLVEAVVKEGLSPQEADEACDAALTILRIGLEELGLGAKTNAGYGRMRLLYDSPAERQAREAAAAQAQRAQEEQRQQQVRDDALLAAQRVDKSKAAGVMQQYFEQLTGPARREFAQVMVNRLGRKWLQGRNQPWANKLLQAAEEKP